MKAVTLQGQASKGLHLSNERHFHAEQANQSQDLTHGRHIVKFVFNMAATSQTFTYYSQTVHSNIFLSFLETFEVRNR